MKVVTFWHGGRLKNLNLLCLASWLEQGYEVDLYHLDTLENAPEGVNLKNAEQVLSRDLMAKLEPIANPARMPWQPIVSYSDLFRIKMLSMGLGIWMDTDMLLFKPIPVDAQKPFYAWDEPGCIGASIFYLPIDNLFLHDFLKVLNEPNLMPHWLGFKRRVLKPIMYKLRGKKYSPVDLGITIYGNDAFTRLVKKHDMTTAALPQQSFYYWLGKETLRFYEPSETLHLENLDNVYGFHVHRKGPADAKPQKGCLYDRMLAKHAHRLPKLAWVSP